MTPKPGISLLGTKVEGLVEHLEGFETPEGFNGTIRLYTDEFTSMCPVTSQPDYSEVTVEYEPENLCIESKSFKLYLMGFRGKGVFCEQLAVDIAEEVDLSIDPYWVRVMIDQKPRGGVSIHAEHLIDNREGAS